MQITLRATCYQKPVFQATSYTHIDVRLIAADLVAPTPLVEVGGRPDIKCHRSYSQG